MSGVRAPIHPIATGGSNVTLPEEILAPCWCGDPACTVPFRFCHCKCGEKTRLIPENVSTQGLVKGMPRKYINGHQRKIRLLIEDAAPFKINGVYCRLIPLSGGIWAIVWASDYEYLMQWKWSAKRGRYTFYAFRMDWSDMAHPKSVTMHRQLLGLVYGETNEGDHENGNGVDNRRDNLRPGSPAEQRRNMKIREDNTTGYPGVSWDAVNGSYRVAIGYGYQQIWLGRHYPIERAIEVRKAAEREYFGKWKRKS